MGREARARGTYEERKAAAVARNAEALRLYREKLAAEQDERDRLRALRRAEMTPEERSVEVQRRVAIVSMLGMIAGMGRR